MKEQKNKPGLNNFLSAKLSRYSVFLWDATAAKNIQFPIYKTQMTKKPLQKYYYPARSQLIIIPVIIISTSMNLFQSVMVIYLAVMDECSGG